MEMGRHCHGCRDWIVKIHHGKELDLGHYRPTNQERPLPTYEEYRFNGKANQAFCDKNNPFTRSS